MKKNLPQVLLCHVLAKITVVFIAVILFSDVTKAQILVEWPLNSKAVPKPTTPLGPTNIATGVSATAMSYNTTTFGATNPNAAGLKLKQSNKWPTVANPTDSSYSLDFPFSPAAGYDVLVTGLTLVDTAPTLSSTFGTSLTIAPYYQIDGKGAWIALAAPQNISLIAATDVNYGTINIPFFYNSLSGSGHTYDVRLYIYSTNGAAKGDYFSLTRVIFYGTTQTATTPPTVTTGTPTASGKYTGIGAGSYSFGATYQNPTVAGVTWGTTPNPNIATSPYSNDGSNGTINASSSSDITGLSAGTLYHVRAFAITLIDTIYGQDLTFTTDAATAPVITTVAASNILSNKATSGGNITDSGGVVITKKGVCWSTVSGTETATSGSNFTNDGKGSTNYASIINSLSPSTTYYAKAYAVNSVGISYGNEISFTTTAAVPVISAIPSPLAFGSVVVNSPSATLSYVLSGAYLTPSSGTITVTPPAGFSISTSSNSGFITAPSVLSIHYTNGTLANTRIFVKLITTNYGSDTGIVLHSGGGAMNPNIDSVVLTGTVTQDPNLLTNLGTDFWVGYGLEEKMSAKIGTPVAYGLQLYIATGAQSSKVQITMPGLPSFTPQVYTIPANTVQIVSGFPTGNPNDPKNAAGMPDSRLYYTGVSNRGIHVEVLNSVPVAVFLYDYATNNSAGGSMVFPTNTWNSSYIVQTYGGATSNQGIPNTYFFVIAKEDSTVVTFKPTTPILDSVSSPVVSGAAGGTIAYPANTTTGYQVTLNKGQVFSAIGLVDATTLASYDLTGTTVASDCGHPISVFAGNSRTLINTNSLGCIPNSGSDNLIQQMFPKVAWGTEYLTVPTKTMEYNVFRIGVQDTSTVVKVDGIALPKSSLIGTGMYYEVEGSTYRKIESNEPVTVTQFILPGDKNCGGPTVGNNGTGDPEMILLSPLQQTINSTTVYTSDFKNGASGGTYINVIIPHSGVASFRLDSALNPSQMVDTGASSYTNGTQYTAAPLIPIAQAFRPHPQDTSYYWAKFHVSYPTVHTFSSNVGFNAIAYGVASGESWGYNAGTAIKDLTAVVTTKTPYGSAPSATTCKGNSTFVNISLPYNPTTVSSLQWVSSADPSVSPANDTSYGSVVSTGTFVQDGVTYYTYQSPKPYTFDSVGTFKFNVTAYGTFTNDCGGSKVFNVLMNVIKDTADFSFAPVSCGSLQYVFTDNSKTVLGDTLEKWQWSFYPGDSSNLENPTDTFPAKGIYQVRLQVINNIGCFSDTIKTLDLTGGVVAQINATPDTACLGTAISFNGTASTSSNGTITTYYWDFNDGTKDTTSMPIVSHAYTTPGTYKASLLVVTAAGCTSNPDTVSVFVAPVPVADFILPGGVCLPGNTNFINNSDTAVTGPLFYLWNFGDGIGTSTNKNPVYAYSAAPSASGYVVTLVATSSFGCIDSVKKTITSVYARPIAAIASVATVCFGDSTIFTDASTAVNQTITNWYWAFGDTASSILQDPKHKYATVDSFTVKLVVTTNKGCSSDTATTIVTINPAPIVSFILPGSCLGSGSATFTDASTITPNNLKPFTYSWSFGDTTSANNASTAQNGQHIYTAPGSYSVIETVTALNGCSASDTAAFDISGSKPKPAFVIINIDSLCSNVGVQLEDTSRIDIGKIIKVEIVWDEVNNPTVVFTDTVPSNGSVGSSKAYTHNYPSLPTNKTYTITLIAYSGTTCLDSATQTITVHGSPVIAFANQAGICANAAPRVITGATETAGPPGVFTYSGPGVTDSLFNPAKASIGSNTIQAMFTTAFGCKDSATSSITVWPVVAIHFSQDTLHACINDSIQLNPITTAQNLVWRESDGLHTLSSDSVRSPMAGPLSKITTYYVKITDSSIQCPVMDSITVYASIAPSIVLTSPNPDTICFGGTARLDAKKTADIALWSPADSVANSNAFVTTATPYTTSTYLLQVHDTEYCSKSAYDTVTVYVVPPFTIAARAGNDTSIDVVPNEPLQLDAFLTDTSFNYTLTYNWSPSKYLNNTDTSAPVLTATAPFPSADTLRYTVTATTERGCEATAYFTITFFNHPDIYVPTAFTPNGDGKNDILVPVPVGIVKFEYFRIYNRFGQLIFSTGQLYKGWDGTINGTIADVGTYIYSTDGIDYLGKSHPHQGTVVLIR